MDQRAQQRLYVLNHILAGELTAAEAADYLELATGGALLGRQPASACEPATP